MTAAANGGSPPDATRAGPQESSDRPQSRGGAHLATIRHFLSTEAGGAVVLLVATVVALVWANSPWRGLYDALWATEISLRAGDLTFGADLGHWINDGLMTLFFLLVGLEIRREFDMGEFRERRRAAVPIVAALGGMVLPVLIFLALNPGGDAARGWAMVMATDTAFAVGVLALVGRRSSMRLRVFLLTLVIVDDVAAVGVIAVFYTTDLEPVALGVGLALLGVMAFLRARGFDGSAIFAVLAVGIWLAAWNAGVHPTVGGVAVGLLTGAHPPRRSSLQEAIGVTRAFRQQPSPHLATAAARRITMSLSPNDRWQHAIHPWTSYVAVPLFALANAGIDLSGDLVGRILGSPLTIGIVLGLVVGKSVGIPLGAWLATRRWLGGLSLSVGWPSLIAASAVAGIGFTVSLLIAELSYTGELLEQAKLGILAASALAALLSLTMFYALSRISRDRLRLADARTSPPLPDLVERVDPSRDHIRGSGDAPITLLEYGDFECPHCARAAPMVRELLARSGGRLRHAWRHLPLVDVHPNAALAAEAAEAAGAQGRFWEMHDLLFERQDRLLLADLIRYAEELGLDVETFERNLRDGLFGPRVAQDVESAEESGVVGTPTFFVNDLLYRGPHDLDSLDATIGRAGRMVDARSKVRPPEQGPPEQP